LFPILFKKVIAGEEKLTQQKIQDTLNSVSNTFMHGSLDEVAIQELSMSFILLNCSTKHGK
jgi:hypothetical protein